MERENENMGEHSQKNSVVIIEDDYSTCEYLKNIINESDVFTCKRTFSDCEDAFEELKKELHPDIILIDLHYSGGLTTQLVKMKGIEVIDKLHDLAPATSIVVISDYYDRETVLTVVAKGVTGYLCKPVDPEHLMLGLKNAAAGLTHYSPEVVRHIRSALVHEINKAHDYNLTRQERNILPHLVEGISYKEIAKRLFISTHTVHRHFMNIYHKLNVHTRAEAIIKLRK